MTVAEQVISVFSGVKGFLDDVELPKIKDLEKNIYKYIQSSNPEIIDSINNTGKLDDETEKKLKSSIFGFRQVIELYGHVMLGEDSLSELHKLLENNKDLSDSEEILMSRAELMTLVGKPRRIANKKILRN